MGTANKVVVRYRDGRLIKGTTRDFLPGKPMFHVHTDKSPDAVQVPLAELKAVFFVKRLEGDRSYSEKKYLPEKAVASLGKKIAVVFTDGEILTGHTHSYSASHPGFFVTPVDPKSNNIRVFVVRESVREVKMGPQAESLIRTSRAR